MGSAHGVGCGAQPLFRPTPEPRRLHPHPNPLPSRERGWVPSSRVAPGVRASTLICHCEEHPLIPSSSRDVAILMRLYTRRRTAVATATGLPRYARNDKVGTRDWFGLTAWLRGAAVVPAYAGTQGFHPHPNPLPSRERGWVTVVVTLSRSTRIRLDLPLRRNAVATATGLPRYARNDKVGTHELFRSSGVGCGVQPWFRLAPVAGEGRGRGRGFCVAGLVRGTLYSLRLAVLGYFAREGRLWTWG